jgi:hypothetical protein
MKERNLFSNEKVRKIVTYLCKELSSGKRARIDEISKSNTDK